MKTLGIIFLLFAVLTSCKKDHEEPLPDYMVERFDATMQCDTISYVRAYFPDSIVFIADTMPSVHQWYHSGDYQSASIQIDSSLIGFDIRFDATPNIDRQYNLIQTGAYHFDPYDRTGIRNGVIVSYNFIPYASDQYTSIESSTYFKVEGRNGNNRNMTICGSFDVLMIKNYLSDTIRVYGEYNLKYFDPYVAK